MTAQQLHEAVDNSYPHERYMHLREVRDATGFDSKRSVDHMAVGMYRSVGRTIHGFEIKVTRGDWLKELSQPAKAESMMRFCDTWALIAPESVVQDNLPRPWGFGVPFRKRSNALLKIVWIIKPPILKPCPYDTTFLTAMIAAARKEPMRARARELEETRAAGEKTGRQGTANVERELDKLLHVVNEFQAKSGIHLNQYMQDATIDRQSALFKEFQTNTRSIERTRRELVDLERQAFRIHRGIERVLNPDTTESHVGATPEWHS